MTKTAAPLIFIGYRRDDGGHARALYEKLLDWFDEGEVFLDHEGIDPGEKFDERLQGAVAGCSVFLAVIGTQWLSEKNHKRLHEQNDVTRGEIRCALEHKKPIIPVLAGGTGFPKSSDLPEDIRAMGPHNAHHQLDAQYRASFQKLLDTLQARYGLKPRYRRRDGSRQPFSTGGLLPSPHFADPTGKLAKLYETLFNGGRAALTAATVQGMGGVGKTSLALKYSHAFRDEYQGVCWLRAEDATLLEQDCEELCRDLDIARRDNEPYSQSLLRWLKTQPAPWLLVYDNADDPAKVRGCLPESGGHHALFTSRNPNWKGIVRAEQQIDLETWSDDEALVFLRSRLPRLNDDDGRRLSHALGGLPLALEMAASYLDENDCPVADYLDALNDVEESPRLLGNDTPDNGYPHSVYAALTLAYDKLSPAAQQLLRLCAWFAPDPIPEHLFTQNAEALPEELQAVANKAMRWRETVGELKRYALCKVEDLAALGKGEKALLLHRLTQQAIRTHISDAAVGAHALTLLHHTHPADVGNPRGWPLCAALLPHVRRLQDLHTQGLVGEARALLWLLDRAASYLQFGPALYGAAVELFQYALVISRTSQGESHPGTLGLMNNLAGVLRAQGNLTSARDLNEKVRDICRHVLGEEHPDTLTAMNNLAHALSEQGDLSGAQALHEKELTICRRVLGEEHPNTLISMNNLAAILHAQKSFSDAQPLHEKTMDIRRRVLGEEHPDTLTSMNNLASTLQAQGNLNGARALQEKALDICRRVLGDEHPDTSISAFNLLATLVQMQEHEDAGAVFRKYLAWLLECEPSTLGAYQQNIRAQLLVLFNPDSPPERSTP